METILLLSLICNFILFICLLFSLETNQKREIKLQKLHFELNSMLNQDYTEDIIKYCVIYANLYSKAKGKSDEYEKAFRELCENFYEHPTYLAPQWYREFTDRKIFTREWSEHSLPGIESVTNFIIRLNNLKNNEQTKK